MTLIMLIAADYQGVLATTQRVLRAPGLSRAQRAEALACMGGAYAMQNQHDECYAVLSAALDLTPDDPMLWYNRGMAARFTMRIGRSLRDFERAQALVTEGPLAEKIAKELPFARSLAEDERKLRGREFTIDQLIAQEELFQQAVRAMEQHRWDEAEPLFREAIVMGDCLPQPQGNLGLCLIMQRRFDEAEAALRRALEIDPKYAIARRNLIGLPLVRASGNLPEIRVSSPFEGQKVKQTLSFLVEGERQSRNLP